ncbi:MAG: hypothetical protein ACMXYG_04520 [Candidatus Woesearchaeota archaeon]
MSNIVKYALVAGLTASLMYSCGPRKKEYIAPENYADNTLQIVEGQLLLYNNGDFRPLQLKVGDTKFDLYETSVPIGLNSNKNNGIPLEILVRENVQ